ncbi:MAG TPA: TIGR03619 family F420-dependent LLM class oxidoreductase [Candidatus Binataceae bacterium]|nr:TIGR03619 family F420-dependent LLM class oxidoreductase [Candidatus Binataceae bacterium]
MKFGTFITSIRPERITANLRKAEEVGFESAWIGEHLIMPVEFKSRYPYSADGRFPAPLDVPFHDPMLALAYAAAATSEIKLATGIFVVPLRNPVATAKSVASLDVLSNGRLIFGVGIGWFEEEFAAAGAAANFLDRALRTREYIEMMKALWTQADPAYEGSTCSVKGVRFYPKPIQRPHPPIVVGGISELAMKRAVRYGDGWYAIARSIDEARGLISRLRHHQQAAHRTRPVEITMSLRTGHPLTDGEVRRLAEFGVDRTLVGLPLRALDEAELAQFHDDVMAKV